MDARDMHYSMIIQWEPQGGVFVVTVPELPLKTHGKSYEEAISQALEAIDSWRYGSEQTGEAMPSARIYDLGEVTA